MVLVSFLSGGYNLHRFSDAIGLVENNSENKCFCIYGEMQIVFSAIVHTLLQNLMFLFILEILEGTNINLSTRVPFHHYRFMYNKYLFKKLCQI